MSDSIIDIAKAPITAYNDKNWDKVRETVSPAVVYDEISTHRTVTGAGGMVDAWRGWANALPDSKASFDRASANGNTVTLEITWRGTHTGILQTPSGDIQPTGRKIEVRACQVIDVADGKVTSARHYFDLGTILRQIGAA